MNYKKGAAAQGVAIAAVAILAIAGGTYAYVKTKTCPTVPITATDVIKAAADIKSDTDEFSAYFNLTTKEISPKMGKPAEETSASFSFDGDSESDQFDLMNPKMNPKMSVNLNIDFKGAKINTMKLNGFKVNMGLKFLDKIAYVKIVKFPEIPFFPDLSAYNDKWIKIDIEALAKPYLNGQNPFDTAKNAEKQKKRIDFLIANPPFELSSPISTSRIKGVEVQEHDITLNNENIKKYVTWVFEESLKENSANSQYKPSAKQIAQMKDEMNKSTDQLLNGLQLTKAKIWIGKKDRLPYKTEIDAKVSVNEGDINVDVEAAFKIELSKFNKPKKISAPSDFITVQDIIKDFQGLSGTPGAY